MRFTYQYKDETHTVDVASQPDGRLSVLIGERTVPIQAQPLPHGGWRIVIAGMAHIVYTASQGDQRHLQASGAVYTVQVPGARISRRKTVSTGDELMAQMPGQVTAVLVEAGNHVKRGQTLMILEAMKMEIRIAAPIEGRILQVMTPVGTVVERGQRLIHMSPL